MIYKNNTLFLCNKNNISGCKTVVNLWQYFVLRINTSVSAEVSPGVNGLDCGRGLRMALPMFEGLSNC